MKRLEVRGRRLFLLGVPAMLACHEPTNPLQSLQGKFALQSVDGKALPVHL